MARSRHMMTASRRRLSALLGAALLGGLAAPGRGHALDNLMLGGVLIVKDTKLAKVVGKRDITSFAIPMIGGPSDPRFNSSSAVVYDTGGPGILSDPLTAGTWTGLGNPPGSTGYKYKNPAAPAGGPVKIAIVKATVAKIIARDDGSLDGPVAGTVAVTLQLGSDRFCAEFGGTEVKNDAGLVKRVRAPAPASCPPAPPPTTTSSTMTPTSTSTTITAPPCCNGASFHSFVSNSTGGDCGDIVDVTGATPFGQLACGATYLGAGQYTPARPIVRPDLTQMVTSLTGCAGSTATLGATSSAMTGTNYNCTGVGCRFGAPVPITITDPGYEDLLFCLVGTVSGAATGSLDCSTGAENMNVAVTWNVYQTNPNVDTDPGDVIPGSQPCPICQGGLCVGGANNGMACTPGSTAIGAAFPTSQDCPPSAIFLQGSFVHNFQLTTGAVTWNATAATNDPGSTVVNQTRVFAGYCRDADGSGTFEMPPHQCWENGMAVGAPCSGVYETCEQRDNGAFGPNGGAIRTLTVVGSPQAGILSGPAAGTLVALFAAPQMASAGNTVDNILDTPGPGAITMRGTGTLCTVPSPCP